MIEVTHRASTADTFRGRVTKQGAAELEIHSPAPNPGDCLSLRLPSAWMTPAQQIAWLERLALAAEELCEQIRLANDIPTIGNTAHRGISLVPLVRFDGPGGAA